MLALDFGTRNLSAPMYAIDPGPYATFCPPSEPEKWDAIRQLAATYGFFG
jgi:hypothetical protein